MTSSIVPCPPTLRAAARRELRSRLAALRAEAQACCQRALEVGLEETACVVVTVASRVDIAIAALTEETGPA